MTDLSAALRELAGPGEAGDRIKAAIARAAKRAGLSYWRTFDIWYGKARRIEEAERTRIAEALERRRREAAVHELHDIKIRIARIEALLARTAADGDRSCGAPLRRGGVSLE
jgi:hypothetical protein